MKLKKNSQFLGYNQTYLRLIKEEQDVAALAEVVTSNVRYVRDYAEYLKDTHEDLIGLAYKHLIDQEASMATNRSGYRAVASLIKECSKVLNENLAKEMTEKVRKMYSRKLAFSENIAWSEWYNSDHAILIYKK